MHTTHRPRAPRPKLEPGQGVAAPTQSRFQSVLEARGAAHGGGGSAGGRGGVRRAERLLTPSFALFLVCRERRTSTSPMMSYLASGKHHKILSVEVIGERHLGR